MKRPASPAPPARESRDAAYFPVFLRLDGRRCLVVGGGEIGARKVAALVEARARVTVVAPELVSALEAWVGTGTIACERRGYASSDLDGVALVIAATDDRALNARVSTEAQAAGIPVNVVDDPALCSFIVPSVVARPPVIVAISTGGASPALARHLRTRIEAALPGGAGALAQLIGEARSRVRERLPTASARAAFWERVVGGEVGALGLSGRVEEARRRLEELLADLSRSK